MSANVLNIPVVFKKTNKNRRLKNKNGESNIIL